MADDLFPATWTGRRAIVSFPEQVDISNVDQLRDRLLSVINRGATVLIADMTSTVSCDHAAVDAIARACQRAAASGTQLRLVVTAPLVRRVLSIEGLDRLVAIYPLLDAAIAAESALPALSGSASPPQARPMADRARLAAQRKDGATFPVEISLSPVPTATERYVLAVIRDATQARQRDDLADLARGVAAGQPQLARELLDRVVQHLFQ